jgi:LysR family glycine cleavage system transcriptional activator
LPWLSDALERIAVGMESVTGPGRPSLITISTQPNFALKWLIPRLPRFAAAFPSAEIQVVTGSRSLDVANEDFDAAVRYLDARMAAGVGVLGRVGQLRVDPLFRADLVPVTSPRLFPPDVTHDLQRLRDHTLLHVSTSPDDWRLWLEAAGVTGIDAERGPKFDSYALAIEAAAQGWGIAMGRSTFLGADLASGRLTMPFARPLPGHGSWFLLTARDASMKMAGFRRWILREAASCQAASSLPATNLPRKKP